MSAAAHLDQVWQSSDDPFGYRTRWYEQRKRELLLAVLPWPGFGRGWEIGCANGELTHALAGRCKALLGTDLHPRAVAAARARCSALAHVEVRQMEHPREWPDGRFDLVVVGEVGYYLDAPSLARFVARLEESLAPGAVVVGCHWQHDFQGRCSSTAAVHACLAAVPGLARLARYSDADVLLECWSLGPVSVAAREGLR